MKRLPNRLNVNSGIYVGKIRHRRFVPKAHKFSYPLFMLYLDLDELPQLFAQKWFCSLERFNIVSFKREDYLSPENPSLKDAVIEKVTASLGGSVQIHSVRALLHVRYLNVVFNPVVFYYCFDSDNKPVAILSEVTNTPWGERHHYVLPINESLSNDAIQKQTLSKNKFEFLFDKAFHVSPFNPMNMAYRWIFSIPSTRLHAHLENRLLPVRNETIHEEAVSSDVINENLENRDEKHFDATLILERKEFDREFGKILIQYPFITVKVIIGIYWQAFKLLLKRVPFYDHPKFKDQEHV
ncbi:MAG: DUF1365 family protein [Oleiphilaceae bacterium]|jgi:DUF1365 family protein